MNSNCSTFNIRNETLIFCWSIPWGFPVSPGSRVPRSRIQAVTWIRATSWKRSADSCYYGNGCSPQRWTGHPFQPPRPTWELLPLPLRTKASHMMAWGWIKIWVWHYTHMHIYIYILYINKYIYILYRVYGLCFLGVWENYEGGGDVQFLRAHVFFWSQRQTAQDGSLMGLKVEKIQICSASKNNRNTSSASEQQHEMPVARARTLKNSNREVSRM